MVLPVTGPYASVTSDGYVGSFRQQQEKWKQAKPVDRPLAYNGLSATHHHAKGYATYCRLLSSVASSYGGVSTLQLAALKNKSYDSLKDQVSSQSQLGVALFELSQSVGMIAGRAVQLAQFTRQLRKFDFKGAAQTLKMPGPPKGVSKSKSLASNWLEFSFGWSPLIGDIYSACDVLQNPIKSIRPSGRASGSFGYKTTQGSRVNWYSQGYSETTYVGMCHVKQGCTVTITNPNLYLANQLGLINPLTIAWELIPFSFVVDWFINVEQFLSQATDFYGLSVTHGWTQVFNTGSCYDNNSDMYKGWNEAWRTFGHSRRTLGLSTPTLRVRPWKVPSWRRAANAAAVLVQVLSKK